MKTGLHPSFDGRQGLTQVQDPLCVSQAGVMID